MVDIPMLVCFCDEVLGAIAAMQITEGSEEQEIFSAPSIIQCIHIQSVVIFSTDIYLCYGYVYR